MNNLLVNIICWMIWAFHGRAEFIKVEVLLNPPEKSPMLGKYFTRDWSPALFRTIGAEPEGAVEKPENLREIIKCAEALAGGFDFVRVDFYALKDGTLRFGEMTFSPACGAVDFEPAAADREIGELWKIPERNPDGSIRPTMC